MVRLPRMMLALGLATATAAAAAAAADSATRAADAALEARLAALGIGGCALPRHNARSPAWEAQVTASASGAFVVDGLGEGWKAMRPKRWQRAGFLRRHRARRATVRWALGQVHSGLLSRTATVGEYAASMGAQPDAGLLFGRSSVGVGAELGEPQEWSVPRAFADAKLGNLSQHVLSLGPSRAGLPLHNHGEQRRLLKDPCC